jgi:HTH-type transcriptional regulator/antitoxin HigA
MIRVIRNEDDYDYAIGELRRLWGAPEGSDRAREIEVWAMLIDAYEGAQIGPNPNLDPVDFLKAEMDMNGRGKGELAAIIGGNRASEVLARRRALTLPMIRAISRAWNIPVAPLTAEYQVERPPVRAPGRTRQKRAGVLGKAPRKRA